MSSPLLLAEEILVTPVLRRLSLSIQPSEILQIKGRSGAGKTSLLRALVRATPNHQANIVFQDRPVTCSNIVRFRADAHYVSQTPTFPAGTIEDLFREPFAFGVNQGKIFDGEKARAFLEQFDLPQFQLTTPIAQVSGGEIQRLCLIRSLLLEPTILFLDEPASALDRESASQTFRTLFETYAQREKEWALIVVAHMGDEVITQNIPRGATYREQTLEKGSWA